MRIAGKAALTLLGAGVFVGGCVFWGERGAPVWGLHIALVTWVALVIPTARLWAPPWQAGALVLGAALTALAWSFVFVDFPPHWFESAALPLQLGLALGPVLLTPAFGLVLGRRAVGLSPVALLMGYLGTLPVAIRNVEEHVAGGWRMYPYPALAPAILGIAMAAVVGALGGYLGAQLRARALRR